MDFKETKIHLDFSSKSKADWIKVFNDLIDRGLKRVMLIVSDDFPGITKVIETLFLLLCPIIENHRIVYFFVYVLLLFFN